jgi:hypothetical protein
MGGELGLETKVLEMLLDLLSDEGSHHTESLGLSGVELENWGVGCKREQNGWVSMIGWREREDAGRERSEKRKEGSLPFFSNPREISSSRGIQMFSDEDIPLKLTSYS